MDQVVFFDALGEDFRDKLRAIICSDHWFHGATLLVAIS
jgi:hypothetical protein